MRIFKNFINSFNCNARKILQCYGILVIKKARIVIFVNNWNAKTKHDKELREQGKNLLDAYYQMITEENKESCNSEYVGTLKKRDDYNLKVTHVKGHYDSLKISCVDKDGNKIFFFYSGDIEVKVDDEFSLRGTPVDHKEILGIKWTRINRVKFQ